MLYHHEDGNRQADTQRLPRVLEWVKKGEEVTVLSRSRPVARLCPPRPEAPAAFKSPNFAARARRIFGNKRTQLSNLVLEEREHSRW